MSCIEGETMLVVGMLLAIGAGALSFLSPCVLPIFPAYMSYITGVSVKELQGEQNARIRRTLLSHSLIFLLGVSIVFIGLGAGVSFLDVFIKEFVHGYTVKLIQLIAGIFIIVMGLFIGGWINIPFLMQEKRLQGKVKPAGYIGTFFIGLGCAAGWTPCIGPIFGSILVLAMSSPGQGIFYTAMYVVGFALPFLILTFFLGSTKWIVKYSGVIMKTGAVIMILMGLMLFFGLLPVITNYLLDLVEGTWLSRLG